MKRLHYILLGAGLFSMALVGCGPQPDTPVVVTYLIEKQVDVGFDVTLSKTTAKEGDVVIVTIVGSDYKLEITDGKGAIAFTKTGEGIYSFIMRNSNALVKVTKKTTPTVSHLVTFYKEDTTTIFYTQNVADGDLINQSLIPSTDVTGFDFDGWFTTTSKNVQYDFTVAIVQDTNIYGKWSEQSYAITYKDQGNVDFSGTHESGYPTEHIYGTATSLKGATKEGYTFKGWHLNSDCQDVAITSLGATDYTSDITLYAKWEALSYDITYLDKGGSAFSGLHEDGYPTTHTYGIATSLKGASRRGYAFEGWYLDSTCTGAPVTTLGATDYKAAITLYAKWTAETYDINYYDGGAGEKAQFTGVLDDDSPLEYTYGEGVLLKGATKSGYTFAGWYLTPACSGNPETVIGDDIIGAVNLYAKWVAATYNIVYKDVGGGAFTGTHAKGYPTTHTYGTATTLKTATKTGFNFEGWFTAADGSGNAVTTLGATDYLDDVTLYAKWTFASYGITYLDKGGNPFSGTHAEGYPTKHTYGTATTLKSPAKTGYSFEGWHLKSDCTDSVVTELGAESFTSDITVYADWKALSYSINYLDQGGSDFSGVLGEDTPTTHVYGTATTLVNPTKQGMGFGGWFTTIDCTGDAVSVLSATGYTANITLYAKWVENAHQIGKALDTNYSITCASETAATGETITFTASSNTEAVITGAEVKDSDGNLITCSEDGGIYTFIMPNDDVIISAKYYIGFDEQNVVLKAPVFSDEHCERTSPIVSADVVKSSISTFKTLVGESTFDIWLSSGDRSLTGTIAADEAWYNAYTTNNADAGNKLFFAHGNHDVYWSGCASREEHYNWFKEKGVYSLDDKNLSNPSTGNRFAVVNGVNFMAIDITSYDGKVNPINTATQTWAKNILNTIDPTKPVFVLCHCTAPNTCLGSKDNQSDGVWGSSPDLYNILKDYKNVVLLSGHTHYDGHSEENIWQGDFTSINVPTLAGGNVYDKYNNGILDRLYDVDASGNKTYKPSGVIDGMSEAVMYGSSQGMYLEVDSHNNSRITRYDLKNGVQMGKPWIISAPDAEGTHLERYSDYNRMLNDEGLYFDGSAAYSVTSNKVTVNWDSFKHYGDDLAYAYEVQIFNGKTESELLDKTVPTERKVIYANWYKNATYATDTYSYTFGGSYSGNYVVRIIGFDSLGKYTIVYPTMK